MKRSIVVYFIFLAIILGCSLPMIIKNGVAWWKCVLYILWVAFVWALIVLVFSRVSRRIESHNAEVIKKEGSHEYRPRIKNSKLLIELQNDGFDEDNFGALKGKIKKGQIKGGDVLKIYDVDGDFVCDAKIKRIEINGNKVKFASENDEVVIYVDSDWLNETTLPDGSVAVK